jgi:hypothetical protein
VVSKKPKGAGSSPAPAAKRKRNKGIFLKNNNMIPFDLSAAVHGAKICTRDGHAAEFIGIDDSGKILRVKARVMDKDAEQFYYYTKWGALDAKKTSNFDLFMEDNFHENFSVTISLNITGVYNGVMLSDLSVVEILFKNGRFIEETALNNAFMIGAYDEEVIRWFDYYLLSPHAKYIIAPTEKKRSILYSKLFSESFNLEEKKAEMEEEYGFDFKIWELYNFFVCNLKQRAI